MNGIQIAIYVLIGALAVLLTVIVLFHERWDAEYEAQFLEDHDVQTED